MAYLPGGQCIKRGERYANHLQMAASDSLTAFFIHVHVWNDIMNAWINMTTNHIVLTLAKLLFSHLRSPSQPFLGQLSFLLPTLGESQRCLLSKGKRWTKPIFQAFTTFPAWDGRLTFMLNGFNYIALLHASICFAYRPCCIENHNKPLYISPCMEFLPGNGITLPQK